MLAFHRWNLRPFFDRGDDPGDRPDNPQQTPTQSDPYARIRALYNEITGGAYTPSDAEVSQWGTNIDEGYFGKIRQAVANWWTQYQNDHPAAPKPTTPTPTTPTPTTPTPTTTDSKLGPLLQPYTHTAVDYIPPMPGLTLPSFVKPPAFSYQNFNLPSWQDVQANDPGYAFRLNEGENQLANSAAAQGLLRSGGTLKDFLKYGQDYASNEYQAGVGRAFQTYSTNRQNALDTYNTNYKTQYVDPYNFDVEKALGEFAPKELYWQTLAAAGQHQNDLNFDIFKWNETWPYTVLSDQERIGLDAARGY